MPYYNVICANPECGKMFRKYREAKAAIPRFCCRQCAKDAGAMGNPNLKQKITSLAQIIVCEKYRARITAKTCISRQLKTTANLNGQTGDPGCRDCTRGKKILDQHRRTVNGRIFKQLEIIFRGVKKIRSKSPTLQGVKTDVNTAASEIKTLLNQLHYNN